MSFRDRIEKRTILLVEDDALVREVISESLDREYNVVQTARCSEAEKQFFTHIDLALVDFMLPDGNGLDILKTIRQMKPSLPVILMSSYSTDDLAIKAFRAGATDYMNKPLSLSYLMGKLSEIFQGKKNEEHSRNVENREAFIMDNIAAFIKDNYTEELTGEQLAEKACMNVYKFSRAFNRRLGQNVRSFINNVRVSKAVELLGNIDLSITDIAIYVGYGSLVHFDRVFKEKFGMSPLEYRRRLTCSQTEVRSPHASFME